MDSSRPLKNVRGTSGLIENKQLKRGEVGFVCFLFRNLHLALTAFN